MKHVKLRQDDRISSPSEWSSWEGCCRARTTCRAWSLQRQTSKEQNNRARKWTFIVEKQVAKWVAKFILCQSRPGAKRVKRRELKAWLGKSLSRSGLQAYSRRIWCARVPTNPRQRLWCRLCLVSATQRHILSGCKVNPSLPRSAWLHQPRVNKNITTIKPATLWLESEVGMWYTVGVQVYLTLVELKAIWSDKGFYIQKIQAFDSCSS